MKHCVEVDEATVAFQVDGAGPALILLHGAGGNSETNRSQLIGRLSKCHTVVRPDFSGSGETVDDGRPLTVAMLAAQAVAAADLAGATPFDLVGFTFGATVATCLAAEYPHLVRSVILLAASSTSADARQTLQIELWRDLIRTDRKALARLLLFTGFAPDFLAKMDYPTVLQFIEEIVARSNWDGLARQLELLLTQDVRDQARRINKPTLATGCTHDYLVPPAYTQGLVDLILNERYLEIATGHLATLESPHLVANCILDFVSPNFRAI
jgi:3-oxoadipate enol-lactonase